MCASLPIFVSALRCRKIATRDGRRKTLPKNVPPGGLRGKNTLLQIKRQLFRFDGPPFRARGGDTLHNRRLQIRANFLTRTLPKKNAERATGGEFISQYTAQICHSSPSRVCCRKIYFSTGVYIFFVHIQFLFEGRELCTMVEMSKWSFFHLGIFQHDHAVTSYYHNSLVDNWTLVAYERPTSKDKLSKFNIVYVVVVY